MKILSLSEMVQQKKSSKVLRWIGELVEMGRYFSKPELIELECNFKTYLLSHILIWGGKGITR